jgi:hypothetical protein
MKKHDLNGYAIPACLLIGIGIGLLIGQVAALTLIGLGVGFLIMFLFRKK